MVHTGVCLYSFEHVAIAVHEAIYVWNAPNPCIISSSTLNIASNRHFFLYPKASCPCSPARETVKY